MHRAGDLSWHVGAGVHTRALFNESAQESVASARVAGEANAVSIQVYFAIEEFGVGAHCFELGEPGKIFAQEERFEPVEVHCHVLFWHQLEVLVQGVIFLE